MYLFSGGSYQTVKPVQPLSPVVQTEQSVFFALLPVEDRAGPGLHAPLDLLQVILGPLEAALQVANRVAQLLDVLPNT